MHKGQFSLLLRITLCQVPKQTLKQNNKITVYNQTKNKKKMISCVAL